MKIVDIIQKPFYRAAKFILNKFPAERTEDMVRSLRMLNPSEHTEGLARKYYEKRIAHSIMLASGGILVSLLCFAAIGGSGEILKDSSLMRNVYGQGEKTEELVVRVDGQKLKERLVIDVDERHYSEEEADKVFADIKKRIPKEILGENSSFGRVENNLNLVSSLGDYPVEISWLSDSYELMDSEGRLSEDFDDPSGRKMTLTMLLDYYEKHDEMEIPITVYPKKMLGEDETIAEIRRETRKSNERNGASEKLKLPEKIGSRKIEYSYPESDLPLTIFVLSLFASIGIYFAKEKELKQEIEKREKQMICDYPEIVSKLTLLLSAGMTLRGAFEKISSEYEYALEQGRTASRYAYDEMMITVRQMRSGKSEAAAYQEFGTRSGVARYNKLGSLLSQNLKKGSSALLSIMEYEARDAFEDRKAEARKRGEEAGTKLLLPMGMMLMVVMIIVIVPSVLSFGL